MSLDEVKRYGNFANNSDDDGIPGWYGREAIVPVMKNSAKWQRKYVHTWHFSSGRMGNARSRACGMNYPLQVYTLIFFSGKGQELGWSTVRCRKQLQQRADFPVVSLSFLLPEPRSLFLMWETLFTIWNVKVQFSVCPVLFNSPEWTKLNVW